MYSIVMMAAIGGGPATPAADMTPAPVVMAAPVYAGCTGCSGYYAGCVGSCYGSCYGSCVGSCYGGCCGGGHKHFGGGRGGLFGRKHSCHGCSGYSCCGGSCFGYGGCCGASVAMPAYGCCGGYGCVGSVYGVITPSPVVVPPVVGTPPMTGTPSTPGTTTPKKGDTGGAEGANLKFRLPAGAKLYVDGRPTGGEGTERAFFTPPLAAGKKYYYDVKAELVAGGQTVVEEKRVIVEAGAEVIESFPKLVAAAEQAGTLASK